MAEKIEYDIKVNGKAAKTSLEELNKAQNKLDDTTTKTTKNMSSNWKTIGLSIAAAGIAATATLVTLSKRGLEAEKAMFGLNDNLRDLAQNLSLMGGGTLEMTAGFVRTAQSAGLSEQAIKKVTEQAVALGRLYPHESTETFIDNLSMLYSSGEAQGYIVDILEQKYGTLDLKTISLADKMALLDEKVRGVNEAFEKTPEGKITKIGAAFDIAIARIGASLNTAGENLRVFDGVLEVFEKFGISYKDIQGQLSENGGNIGVNSDRDINEMQKLTDEIAAVQDALRIAFIKGQIGAEDLQNGLQGLTSWSSEMKSLLEAGFDFSDATTAAKGELKEIESEAEKTAKKIGSYFETTFSSNLADALLDGKTSFSDFANSIIKDIARIIIQQQIANAVSGAMGGFFAQGGVVGGESPVQKRFATGGIVNRPTRFANGGMVGERNRAEAILPLQRTANGDLGVKSAGGGSNVVVNIENQTGSNIDASDITTSSNQEQETINIVLKGISKNTSGIRDLLKGM